MFLMLVILKSYQYLYELHITVFVKSRTKVSFRFLFRKITLAT